MDAPDERLSLPRGVKAWQGVNLADIELENLGGDWIWATSFQMYTGDHHGSSSPLMDLEGYRAPTRQAAIDAASA